MVGKIPQDSEKLQLKASPNTRVSQGQATTINKQFLQTASQGLQVEDAKIKKEMAKRQRQKEDFITTKARNEFRVKRAESEAKVAVSEGASTLKEADQERKSFSEFRDSYLQKVPEDVRTKVAAEIDNQRVKMEETLIPKQYGEIKKLQDATYAQDIKGFQDEAILMSSDLEEFEAKGLQDLKQSVTRRALKKYGEDSDALTAQGINISEVIEESTNKIVSDTIVKSIGLQAEEGAVSNAKNILDKYKDQLTPDDRIKADKYLDSAEKEFRAQKALTQSNSAIEKYPNDEISQEKYIRENTDAETYKEAMIFARGRNEATRRAEVDRKRKDLAEIYNTAEDVYIKNKIPVDPRFLKSIPPENKAAVISYIEKRSKGEAIISKKGEMSKMINLYRTDPEKFIDMTTDIGRLRPTLSKEDIDTLETYRSRALGREESQENRIRNMTDRNFLDLVGRFKEEQNLSSDQEEELVRRIPDWVESFKGRDGITELEMRKKIYDQLKANLKTKYKERWYWTDTSPELTEESVDPVRLPPAHRSYIRAIRDRMPDISDQDLRDKLLELDTKLKKKSRSILSAPNFKR